MAKNQLKDCSILVQGTWGLVVCRGDFCIEW